MVKIFFINILFLWFAFYMYYFIQFEVSKQFLIIFFATFKIRVSNSLAIKKFYMWEKEKKCYTSWEHFLCNLFMQLGWFQDLVIIGLCYHYGLILLLYVFTDDHTRVILRGYSLKSDYINANYVDVSLLLNYLVFFKY